MNTIGVHNPVRAGLIFFARKTRIHVSLHTLRSPLMLRRNTYILLMPKLGSFSIKSSKDAACLRFSLTLLSKKTFPTGMLSVSCLLPIIGTRPVHTSYRDTAGRNACLQADCSESSLPASLHSTGRSIKVLLASGEYPAPDRVRHACP
jgi:hypothetical protein